MKHLHSLTTFLTVSVFAIRAHAESEVPNQAAIEAPPPSDTTGLRADVEIDPAAFVLDGFSLHSGLGSGHWRVDLGVFGLAVPQAFHEQEEFDLSFDGYGVKPQYFLFEPQTGGFVGVDGTTCAEGSRRAIGRASSARSDGGLPFSTCTNRPR